jgi:signal transduction histidine kinase/putative methionine-R-sulfoxide reductase with GAF domain
MHSNQPGTGPEPETNQPNLLDVLERLNRIGSAINGSTPQDMGTMAETLQLIVDSASQVVTGSSAVLYVYDPISQAFDPDSRVSAGELAQPVPGDHPRPNGMAMRSIRLRRRVLSYEEPDLTIHEVKLAAGARVVGTFPLVVAGQVVGVLYVYLREPRPFGQHELLMLDNFVNQAGTAMYHMRQLSLLQQDLARREDELVRLRRAGLLISSRMRLDETLEAILEMALEVTNAHYGIFRLVDKSGRYLVTRAIAGESLGQPATEPLAIDGHSIMGLVAQRRQPLLIPDLHAAPWAAIYYPFDRALEMRSELAVPLIGAASRLEGVLNLESPLPDRFSERDSHLLQSLATQAVIAIQQARLLDVLQEITQRLLLQPTQEVLDRIVVLACDLLNKSASAIWIRDGDDLVLRSAAGGPRRGERLPIHGSLIGEALFGRTVAAPGAPLAPRAGSSSGSSSGEAPGRGAGPVPVAGLLVVPLLASPGSEPIGAFTVYSGDVAPERVAGAEWDTKMLLILGHYAALALDNATRQEALRVAQEQRSVAETFAAMGDISANLLHHLNNKVGTIPVRVEGIQDKCASVLEANPYLANNLAQIQASATEAMEAVRESLSILRPIELGPVSVAACVSQAVAAAHPPDRILVRTERLENLPPVLGSNESLGMVVVNLLRNAVDATPGEGVVTIGGSAGQNYVELSVRDTGTGIPPELHERIFEFNFSGRKSGGSKLGFGLWWVKTLVARLGGSIAVESDGRHGTVFRMRLPRAYVEQVTGK